ncbi:MAG TPA: glycosyltransferase family 9 protein [Caulobacteraceae bacterium]|nr:glycosyltransferase family 9 protein [Caulobacteraceae bacterium]
MKAKRFPILYISSSRIGDAVLASGLLKRLHDEIPDARFTVVAGPPSAPLYRDLPNLDQIIVMEKSKGGGHWFKLWRQVRGRRWGLVLDRRGSSIARFLSARKRAIHRRVGEREPVHKVVEAARLLKLADDPPAPFLFTSDETEARAQALLGDGGPILAMGPAANWAGKTWPVERFALTAVELMKPGAPFEHGRLLILGGPDDRRAAEPLRRSLPRERWIDLTGQADLLITYAALKRARLYIGNDSGLMHLAAAAGTPTVGLFGPSDERLYGPWGRHTRVVRGPRSFAQIQAVDPSLSQPVCHMLDLPVAQVVAAAKDLFAASEPKPGSEPPGRKQPA